MLGLLTVALGFVFVGVLGVLLWAFESGRAADAVRAELRQGLRDGCGLEAEFNNLTVSLFPPEVHLLDLTVSHLDGRRLVSVDEAIATLRFLPLFYGRFQLERVAALGPRAAIVVRDGHLLNLPRCLGAVDMASEQDQRGPREGRDDGGGRAPVMPMVLGITELAIERGSFDITIDDRFQATSGNISASVVAGTFGGSNVALGIDDGRILLSGRAVPLKKFRLLGHLEGLVTRPRAIALDRLEVMLGQIQLEGSGSVDLLGPVYEAKLSASLPLASLSDFVEGLPKMAGDISTEVSVSGSLDAPRATGTLRLDKVRVEGFGFGDEARMDFKADRSGADIQSLVVSLGEGRVRGRGRVEFDDSLSVQIETEAEALSFGRVMDMVTVSGSWVDFLAHGRSTFKGRLLPVRLSGPFDYKVSRFRVFDRAFDSPQVLHGDPRSVEMFSVPQPISCRGRWIFTEEGLEFRNATVATGQSQGDVKSVRLGFLPASGLQIRADFPSFDFADLGAIAGIRFLGAGRLSAVIEGPYARIGARGSLDLDNISIEGVPLGRASSAVTWQNITRLEFPSVRGRLRGSFYEGTVGVTLVDDVPLTILGTVPSGRLEDLLFSLGVDSRDWGDASGELSARFDLTGPIRYLTGPVEVILGPMSVAEERAEKGRAIGRFERGKIIAEAIEIEKHGASILGRATFDPNHKGVSASARTRGARVSSIDLFKNSLPRLDGDLDLSLDVSGSMVGVTGTVGLTLAELYAGPVRIEGGEFVGRVRGATMNVTGDLVGGALGVEGVLRFARGLPYQAKLRIDAIDVPRISAGLEGHEDWSGTLTAEASLSGALLAWARSSGAIELEEARLGTPSVTLETTAPARLRLLEGVLESKRLALAGAGTRFVARGRAGAKMLDLGIEGRVDLGLLERASPLVERAGGVLQVSSAVRGTPERMYLVGNGHIEGGLLEWRGVKQRLTGVTADLTFSQSSVLIERSVGQWAQGEVRASGSVLVDGFTPKEVYLTIDVDDVRPTLSFPRVDLSGRLSGRLKVDGRVDRMHVAGTLDVKKGRARLPNLDLRTFVGSQVGTSVYDPASEVLDLDLDFQAEESVRIRNDTTDVELVGAVRLTGTNQRWGMLGSVAARKGGTVQFFGREYEIETGTVQFTDRYRFMPRYDLVLTTDACDARIRTNVVGTLEDKPSISSTSNPEMDEEDIASCLISGVPESLDSEGLAPLASSALWQLSGVDRQVKKVIPLDQIEVSTEYSSEARAYEPRVLVAKEILDGQLRLEYSSSLVKTTDQRAAVRWRLTPRLTLQAGWASSEKVSYGDLGLDLKRRWEW